MSELEAVNSSTAVLIIMYLLPVHKIFSGGQLLSAFTGCGDLFIVALTVHIFLWAVL